MTVSDAALSRTRGANRFKMALSYAYDHENCSKSKLAARRAPWKTLHLYVPFDSDPANGAKHSIGGQ
jgi:hypothetical protein